MNVCKKCKRLCETHEKLKSIKCSGPCSGQFHDMCTNLNENEIASIKLSTNIKWFCDVCSKSLAEMKYYGNVNMKDNHINLPPKQLTTRIKMLIFFLVILALLITITIFGSIMIRNRNCGILLEKSEKLRSNNLIDTTIDTNYIDDNNESKCPDNGRLCLIDREAWSAEPQEADMEKQVLPLDRVIIAHTATDECHNVAKCTELVRLIQEFHMYSLGWFDIGFNFLISSDGRVYVGRGWDIIGAHTKGFNVGSVGIAFIGTFSRITPTKEQLIACQMLLEEGVRLKKLSYDYRLYGLRQLSGSESPGLELYNIIKKWPHYSVEI